MTTTAHEYLCRLAAAEAAVENMPHLTEAEAFSQGDEWIADGMCDCHCRAAEDARALAEYGQTWGFAR